MNDDRAPIRHWYDSPAGAVYRAFSIAPDSPPEAAHRAAEALSREFEYRYGRPLSEDEMRVAEVGARHRTGPAFVGPLESRALAAVMGWRVTEDYDYSLTGIEVIP